MTSSRVWHCPLPKLPQSSWRIATRESLLLSALTLNGLCKFMRRLRLRRNGLLSTLLFQPLLLKTLLLLFKALLFAPLSLCSLLLGLPLCGKLSLLHLALLLGLLLLLNTALFFGLGSALAFKLAFLLSFPLLLPLFLLLLACSCLKCPNARVVLGHRRGPRIRLSRCRTQARLGRRWWPLAG